MTQEQNLGTPVAAGFATFAILELLGHQQIVGFISEVEIAGTRFLKSEVFNSARELVDPRIHGTASIYCITPIPEEKAWEHASVFFKQFRQPAALLPDIGVDYDNED